MPSEPIQARLIVTVYPGYVSTSLDTNPGNLSYAALARGLLAVSKHVATLTEDVHYSPKDPDIKSIEIGREES